MMSLPDLHDLLERGAGPPAEVPDLEVLWRRGRRRRGTRLTAKAGALAVVVLGVVAVTILDWWPQQIEVGPVDEPAGATLPDVPLPDVQAAPVELPVLQARTGSTVVITRDGSATFVDVDALAVVDRQVPELAPGDPPERLVAGDRLVLYGGDTTYAMDPHPDAEPEPIVEETTFSVFVPSGLPDRIWTRPGRTVPSVAPISQVDLRGNVLLGPTASPGGILAVGLRDLVVLQRDSRLIVWDPAADRIVDEVDGPFPMGTDGDRFAWCDVSCREIHLTDPVAGTTRLVARVPEPAAFSGYVGRLSPDGRYLAAPLCVGATEDRRCALAVLDLERGWSQIVADGWVSGRPPAWSPDSRWVFTVLTDGTVAAHRPGDREASVVPVGMVDEPYGLGVIASVQAPVADPSVLWWDEQLGGGGVADHGHWIVANDDTAFTVAGYGTDLVAIDLATGQEGWRTSTGSEDHWLPLVATREVVLAASKFHDVYGLDASTGQIMWQLELDDGYGATTATVRGEALILVADTPTEADHRAPVVLSVDLRDGSVQWRTFLREGDRGQWGPPVVVGNRVIVRTTPDGSQEHSGVHALDVDSGQLIWTRDVGPVLEHTSFTEVVTQSTGRLVHVPLPGPGTATLNVDSGDVLWEATDAWPLGGSDQSLVMTDGHRVYTVDPATGATLDSWQMLTIPGTASWLIGIDSHEALLVPVSGGVAVVDPASARILRHHFIAAPLNQLVLRDGILLVATQDRGVLAIRIATTAENE